MEASMKIGYFSSDGAGFVGAIVDKKVFNLSLAASKAGDGVLTDLTTLLWEGRFDVKFFGGLYERAKGEQQFWRSLESVAFRPLLRPGKILCLGLNYVEHAREGNVPAAWYAGAHRSKGHTGAD